MAENQKPQITGETTPSTLYKYCPPSRIEFLERMTLRFSRPTEFNDVFDTYYLVPKVSTPRSASERLRVRNEFGVLCLTERADNHLMWVNYAADHTGFVVGFDATSSFFTENERVLGKVNYQSRPNVFSVADLQVCFEKSADWKYEKEWRCVRAFNKSESRDVEFNVPLIKEIVFGWKMEPWHVTRILQWAKTYDAATQFFASNPSRKSWIFENRPTKMVVCDRCNGDGHLANNEATE
jgi:DUF2971 family protein